MLLSEDRFHIHPNDCIPHMHDMPPASVDFSIFSPPFPSLYAYSDSDADLGNVDVMGPESKLHFSFFFKALRRVLKPGRVALVHCCQIPRMQRAGEDRGLHDFRGILTRLGERAGLIYEYDWLIRKNPQSQALRTRSRELQFAGLEKDRAKSRGALADYLIKFMAPGENQVPINSKEVSREHWIKWAEPSWFDIRESDTFNTDEGKSEEDTRHICPLQKEVIRRGVLLFSNPGEIVFSPFAGIGSELRVALKLNRRGYGCEIKPEWHQLAVERCGQIAVESLAPTLF